MASPISSDPSHFRKANPNVSMNRLALETVRIGLAYGVSNTSGCLAIRRQRVCSAARSSPGSTPLTLPSRKAGARRRSGNSASADARWSRSSPRYRREASTWPDGWKRKSARRLGRLRVDRLHGFLLRSLGDSVAPAGPAYLSAFDALKASGLDNKVGNDSPNLEDQFKTIKSHPDFPDRFEALDYSRQLIDWYNHRHWNLSLLTPAAVHTEAAGRILDKQRVVLEQADALHPERFVRGIPRPSRPAPEVWIKPPQNVAIRRAIQLPRDTDFVAQVSQSH